MEIETMCQLYRNKRHAAVALLLMLLMAAFPASLLAAGGKKKPKSDAAAKPAAERPQVDVTKLVWPSPPNIPRVRYVSYFAGMKMEVTADGEAPKQKSGWMDRLAGVQPENRKGQKQMPFQLLGPYGMAVDSKGNLYVADQKVGAIFIFNTETHDTTLIRNGFEAHFGLINGIAIDDDDRIFVTDGKMHRVLIFNAKHDVTDQIDKGLVDPVGIAIDKENRQLYVADTQQDQVFVYDADSLKLIRTIGKGGQKHTLTTPGDFSNPTGVAVDKDGNLYVTDTMNYRVEIFDADGGFISEFGRHCDGPGCFAHPKGIAVDSDSHIWVADPMLDLLQIFDKEGQLLGVIGGHGQLLGQFSSLVDVAIDKNNRVFASDQYPGRVQEFRYITDAEAEQLKKEKDAAKGGKSAVAAPAAANPSQTAEAKPDIPKPEPPK